MKIRIMQICNSQGIRIPRVLLDESGHTEEFGLKVRKAEIIITPVKKTRQGWMEAFRKMAEMGDDELLDKEKLVNQSSWDEHEWSW